MGRHVFGGSWTEEKLERLRKYLAAYTKVMKNQPFRFAYIDAFAGTGYRTVAQKTGSDEQLLLDFAEQDVQGFLDGSARVALQIEPRFSKYIFIEQSAKRCAELQKLKEEFESQGREIEIQESNANEYLRRICGRSWLRTGYRAVLFLDPYGMEVEWRTIEAIARTRAIDLWLLFPLGVAVNRLLKRDGDIDMKLSERLDQLFGTHDWYDTFYEADAEPTLFDIELGRHKRTDFLSISEYFVRRLESIFVDEVGGRVANNPLQLHNSKNNPLYLLCFAAANPRGAPTAVKIAEHILGR